MRIQHNIMAMNAYRNYNTNTSALSKNLEKLSSGYKINRAGDDAAGLAISEKMRAQITGLNAAQKNVKDGISLVKTAEGAMQEIQDMLNRMDYLATQSANGTYDNDVDRKNLQKEVDALKSEINRIADSANFNGIKLLDGSLDPTVKGIGATDAVEGTVAGFTMAAVKPSDTAVLGTDTILHEGTAIARGTQFGVDLHEVSFENKTGQTLEITVGTDKFTLAGDGTGALTAKAIVDKFLDGSFKDSTGADLTAGAATVGGTEFTVTANAGTGLKFVMKDGETPIKGDMEVKVAGKVADAPTAGPNSAAVVETTAGAAAATAVYTYDFAGVTGLSAGSYDVEIAGQTVTVTLADGATDASDLAAAVQAELTAPDDGIGAGTKYVVANTGSTITFTASGNGVIADANKIDGNIKITPTPSGVDGDYNTKTTITDEGQAAGNRTIASTVVTMTAANFANGTVLQIGDQKYTITNDETKKNETNMVYVGDLNVGAGAGLKAAIDRLSVKAAGNTVWTMGQGTTSGQVTFVEKVDAANKSYTENQTGTDGKLKDGAFDLSKKAGIEASLGTVTGAKAATAGEDGKALVLQIGDTADNFNRLDVKVGDMHTTALGIAGLDISKPDLAKNAIETIKNAINTVSSVRGDLGAVQNRLEHTANNLSVMAENIQDAESTIRDTDVAEEMMAYTKNNILIQSAQAMLAQANAVPQGVLQLLG